MMEDLTVAGAFLKMLKGCYRTVVSAALRSFTWGFYPVSPRFCGALLSCCVPVRDFCIFSMPFCLVTFLPCLPFCLFASLPRCLVASLPCCLVAFLCSETGKIPVYFNSEQLR